MGGETSYVFRQIGSEGVEEEALPKSLENPIDSGKPEDGCSDSREPVSALFYNRKRQTKGWNLPERKCHPIQRTSLWVMLLQLAVLATAVFPFGFKVPTPHEETIPTGQEVVEEHEEGTVYCSSTSDGESQRSTEKDCMPCPPNAECKEGKLSCIPGYTFCNINQNQAQQTLTAKACVEDFVSKGKAAKVLEILTDLLKERRGRYDCGMPLDPLFSHSGKPGEKPWSNAINKMCAGPGLTRWQMHFHPDIAPEIADEGVYFWLFYNFLTPQAAAEFDIQVERHYEFVPIANPVDFPDIHERLMREQSRSRGLTYTYTYEGPDPVKPLKCQISEVAQEHALLLLTVLVMLMVGSHFSHNFYLRYYIRKEVLNLIRQNSHHDQATSLTRGISTETIFQLLRERLARGSSFPRFLVKDKITLANVDEVCRELLWSPETGVHAYQIKETNHWWAQQGQDSSMPQGTEQEMETSPLTWSNKGTTVSVINRLDETNGRSHLSPNEQQWKRSILNIKENDIIPQLCYSRNFPVVSHAWAQGVSTEGNPLAATILRPQAVSTPYEDSLKGFTQASKGLDDYSGLMQELRFCQRERQTIAGELGRATQLQQHNP